MAVEHRVPALAAGKAGQRWYNDRALEGQCIEKRNPAREPAKAGEKAEFGSLALLPDAARKAVELDRESLQFTRHRCGLLCRHCRRLERGQRRPRLSVHWLRPPAV